MTYDDLLGAIAESGPRDWLRDDRGRRWTYKRDLLLRVEDSEPNGEGRDTRQEWATGVFGAAARAMCFTVYYGPSWVMDVHMVALDDDRTFIPYPAGPDRRVIAAWDYRFAAIVSGWAMGGPRTLDTRLREAGLAVRGGIVEHGEQAGITEVAETLAGQADEALPL